MSVIRQQWKHWPSPVGGTGQPDWILQLDTELVRVCDIGQSKVGLLTRDGHLYIGQIDNEGVDGLFNLRRIFAEHPAIGRIVDVCPFNGLQDSEVVTEQGLVIVLESGQAYQVDADSEKILASIVNIRDQPGSPEKDFSASLLGIYTDFKRCVSGKNHLVLVDTDGRAWSTGHGPQTGLVHEVRTSTPNKHDLLSESFDSSEAQIPVTRIDFFQGVKIIGISSGQDFNVALVERDEDQESPDVLTISRTSCPLGLPIVEMRKKSNEISDSDQVELRKKTANRSMAVLDVTHKDSDSSDNNIVCSEIEEKEDRTSDSQQVERLARSGLYINPSDAIKFLSDQLSWIGIGVSTNPDEISCSEGERRKSSIVRPEVESKPEIEHEEEEETKQLQPQSAQTVPEVDNIVKPSLASTLMSDGIKVMGSTVSKLTRTFSTTMGSDQEKKPEVVDLILSDINMINEPEDTNSIAASSSADDRPPSPLPVTTRKPVVKSNSMKRSSTYIPSGDFNKTTSAKLSPQRAMTMCHRRSQSATFLPKLLSHHQSISDSINEFSKLKAPKTVFDTEVWFWGKGRRGQCGQGDMLDRLQPSVIACLSKLGIQKVVCGKTHCLAIALTGVVYGWGDNSMGQSCPHVTLALCSIPQVVCLPVGETAVDICAAENFSFILSDTGAIFGFGSDDKNKRSQTVKKLNLDDPDLDSEKAIRKILVTSRSLFGSVAEIYLPLANLKSLEKMFLRKLCDIEAKVIEPLCGKCDENSKDLNEKAKAKVLSSIRQIIEVVSRSVLYSWPLFTIENCCQLPILKEADALGSKIESYTKQVCDCLVVGCLRLDGSTVVTSGAVADLLEKVCHISPGKDVKEMLQVLLLDPTTQIQHYISCLQNLVTAGRKSKQVSALKTCDNLESSIQTLKTYQREIEKEKKLTAKTSEFWELAGTKLAGLKIPTRRIVLDSRVVQIGVSNAASFSKHWIILMNDILVHAGYSTHVVHPLQTIWIESHQTMLTSQTASMVDTDSKFEIALVMPEENLILSATSAENKMEWFVNLQKCILHVLGSERVAIKQQMSVTPPITRCTSYTFKKIPELRGAEYQGSWMHGKLHGQGTLKWPDGRMYSGQLRQNQRHGVGKMEVVEHSSGKTTKTVFDGQWKCDKFEGHGTIIYASGDVYKGSVKEGKPHGQGVLKQGKFMGSGASVYVGEWSLGFRNGYGVLDDIVAGEKYMGMWCNDMKSGSGCVVTLDGVYYEGTFSHGKMTGRGLMMFEDETVYEGYFADAGVFSGHGVLTYANGDRLDGSFYGNYSDGMKFNGTVYKTVKSPVTGCQTPELPFGQDKIGTYSVQATRKWSSVLTYYQDILGLPDHRTTFCESSVNTQASWEHLAIQINQNKNAANLSLHQLHREQLQNLTDDLNTSVNSSIMVSSRSGIDVMDGLEMIPDYHSVELTQAYFQEVSQYLSKAFMSPFHPLSNLLSTLCDCFAATYGGVRVHPRLLKHAVDELNVMVDGLYHIVHALFPALPPTGREVWIPAEDDDEVSQRKGETVSASSIIYPYVLPKIYASIFMLYALHYKKEDDEYWARIYKWNRHPDIALLSFLEVDEKFWTLEADDGTPRKSFSHVRDCHFVRAIETLQQIKTTFTPFEKLDVLLETFREINRTGQATCGRDYSWSMDELFPVFQYIVVRARILQLGAEIHMIEDLTQDSCLRNGEFGIMFTTLQASYYQILRESISMNY